MGKHQAISNNIIINQQQYFAESINIYHSKNITKTEPDSKSSGDDVHTFVASKGVMNDYLVGGIGAQNPGSNFQNLINSRQKVSVPQNMITGLEKKPKICSDRNLIQS